MEQFTDKIYIIGIDVSKAKLDIKYNDDSPVLVIENKKQAFKRFNSFFPKDKGQILVLLEATGGYEKAVVKWLLSHHIPVAIVNAKRVRDFAKSSGQFAKNDTIDAAMIRDYGQIFSHKLHLEQEKGELEERIEDLNRRRNQLVSLRNTEKRHLACIQNTLGRQSINRTIKYLDKELLRIEEKLQQALEQDKILLAKAQLFMTAKGVGLITAYTLIGELPELGQVDNRKIAALAGIAPYCSDSGNHKGKRTIFGGRGMVRSALYMATLSARKFNPTIKRFYDRLIAKGKPHKVTMVACMRKLLTILNTMAKNNEPWHENFA